MTENKNEQQVNANFFNLVISLSQSAFVNMGKTSNPQTGKVEKNLQVAKINIDILQMLREKTQGNLLDKEKEVLNDSLTNLQLNYAQECKKEAEKGKEEVKKPESEKNNET